MIPHSSLLLRRRLGERWGGKGPGGANCLAEEVLGTFLHTQRVLLPAAFSNPNPLTAARSPSSPTFRLLLLPRVFPDPLPFKTPAPGVMLFLPCLEKAFLVSNGGLVRWKKARRASRESLSSGRQVRRPRGRRMLSGVYVFA